MYVAYFAIVVTETNVGTACLEVYKVGAGRNFTVFAVAWEPYFDVVSLGRAETDVPGSQGNHTIWKAQCLKHFFCIVGQAFEFFPGMIRMCEFYHFNLVELVLTDDTAGITTGRACFGTEAWAECAIFYRKVLFGEDFISVVVGYRHFSGWNEVIVGVFQVEHVFCKLRQLTGTKVGSAVGHVWWNEFGITVLVGVHINHKCDNSTFQACSQAFVEYKAATGYLGSTVKVQNVEGFTEFPVCLGF